MWCAKSEYQEWHIFYTRLAIRDFHSCETGVKERHGLYGILGIQLLLPCVTLKTIEAWNMSDENIPAKLGREGGSEVFTAFLQEIADHNGEVLQTITQTEDAPKQKSA